MVEFEATMTGRAPSQTERQAKATAPSQDTGRVNWQGCPAANEQTQRIDPVNPQDCSAVCVAPTEPSEE